MLADVKFFFINSFLISLTYIVSVTGVTETIIASLAYLLIIDWITGIWKAVVLGKPVESKYGTVGFISKVFVLLIPLTLALVGQGLGQDVSYIVMFVFSALIVNEGYSALSNLSMIFVKKELPEWSAIEMVFERVQQVMLALMRMGKKE